MARSKKKSGLKNIIILLLLAGAGAGYWIYSTTMFGKYKCDKIYESLEFVSGHRVYIGFLGTGTPKSYRVDGKKVIISGVNNNSVVFTKSGGRLVATAPIIGKITCSRP